MAAKVGSGNEKGDDGDDSSIYLDDTDTPEEYPLRLVPGEPAPDTVREHMKREKTAPWKTRDRLQRGKSADSDQSQV